MKSSAAMSSSHKSSDGKTTEDPPEEKDDGVETDDAVTKSTEDEETESDDSKAASANDEPEDDAKDDDVSASGTDKASTGENAIPRDRLPPTRAHLFAVASIVALTYVWWGGTKLICNYHPFESHPPEPVTLEQMARDPKHAAIEFQHRISICDFEGALALSEGKAAAEVEQLRSTMSKDVCEERRRFAPRVLSFGELLTKDRQNATARVHTQFNELNETTLVELERQRGTWKALSRTPQ